MISSQLSTFPYTGCHKEILYNNNEMLKTIIQVFSSNTEVIKSQNMNNEGSSDVC